MHAILDHLLGGSPFVVARDRPEVRGILRRALDTGDIVRILPGVYARPADAATPEVRCAAYQAVAPDAVFMGATASFLHGWSPAGTVVEVADVRGRAALPGFRLIRRSVAPELITSRHGMRCSSPALTVLELATSVGSSAIDDGLRRGISLPSLWAALELTRGRRGHQALRRMLTDSRDEPWSHAEREAHRLLRREGLSFRANHAVGVGSQVYYLDAALPGLRLGLEVDGRAFHSGKAAFEYDRERDAELAARDWQIVRFPATLPLDSPSDFTRLAMRLVHVRARLLGVPVPRGYRGRPGRLPPP